MAFQFIEGENRSDVYGETTKCKIFVGPWRAVVELALFLHENGWNYDNGYRRAFVTFPNRLVRELVTHQGTGRYQASDVRYPPLLPPQDAFGVQDGLVPTPLGDLDPYRRGGPEELQDALRQAVDRAFPVGGSNRDFVLANPRAPRIWLRRTETSEPKIPVLCVLSDSFSASGIYRTVYRESSERLDLVHSVDGDFLIAPNLPAKTLCYDPEGFFRMLPSVVRQLEEEHETAWTVEDFVMGGTHEGRDLKVFHTAGPRFGGW